MRRCTADRRKCPRRLKNTEPFLNWQTGIACCRCCTFGLGEKIDCLNKIYRPQEYERFSALADFLGSSRKALAIRMKQLGLVKKEYLDNPFDMISIYK